MLVYVLICTGGGVISVVKCYSGHQVALDAFAEETKEQGSDNDVVLYKCYAHDVINVTDGIVIAESYEEG